MTRAKLDPISLGIIWRRMSGLMDEIGETFIRSSFSSVVRENADMAVALLDSQGRQFVQSSRSVPSFIGTMPRTLAAMLKLHPAGTLKPGDVLITNDSWLASGHLNDITMIKPLFVDGGIIGYIGSVFHTVDIGGAPNPYARDSYEEGICIPVQKMMIAGEENATLVGMLEANLREPMETLGDLRAQFAAYRVAERRIVQILREEGLEKVDDITEDILARSEGSMRRAIETIPDGTYHDEIFADGFDEPIRLCAALTVDGSDLTIDYAGSSPQVQQAVNCVMNFTYAYTAYGVKCALDPETPHNSGAVRPLTILAPEGSIVNATRPAPVWGRHLTGHYLPCLVFGALAPVIPNKIIADSGSPLWNAYFRGVDMRSKKRFVRMFFMNGGYGGRPSGDGPACLAFPTNVSNTSAETFETSTPMRVLRKELITDSGGAGLHRGGLGQRIALESLSDEPLVMTIRHERVRFPARGFLGGEPGRAGIDYLNDKKIAPKGIHPLKKGDVVTFETPGGGGFKPAAERDEQQIARDIRLGYLSPEAAAQNYGSRWKNAG